MGSQAKKIILARTQPRRELWAAENIQRQGHEFYLPRCYTQRNIANSRNELRIEPLFPGYIFVMADQWHWLLGTFGIASVLMRGEQPDWVPDHVIEYIKTLEDNPTHGVVLLPETELEIDQVVRINHSGAFNNHIGIVQGMDARQRVSVLIDFMGGKVKVLVSRKNVRAVA